MKYFVYDKRIAEINRSREQELFPKIADHRQMSFKIKFPEMMCYHRIAHRGLVKVLEEAVNVLSFFDILLVHSVEMFPSPFKAALKVCQLSEAHFTRAGNSSTPAKILRRPRCVSSFSGS
ncbi:MAG: hypothetical protein ACJ73D_02105, partial [Pyrinomonadaceae bacterium]